MKQRTIKDPITLSGVGLHSGVKTTVVLKPAGDNEGITFIRTDLAGKPRIKLSAATVVMDKAVSRCTQVEDNNTKVSTIEHLLAALRGLRIDNLTIEINGLEVPGLDGSSRDFVEAIKGVGIAEGCAEKYVYRVTMPIAVHNGSASVLVAPADDFKVDYQLDYDYPGLNQQSFALSIDGDGFENELASARTFCLEREAELIRAAGLGLGANHQNTLIMGPNGPLDNQLRFPDECCRHKALDIVGDLYLLGYEIRGAVYGVKSGHALNRELVKLIEAQRTKIMSTQPQHQRVFDIDFIRSILPHRYPFLFVDRVYEIEKGKKGIGIKNVTANDGFFQGHFPAKPVMPGVIMIEAMAQTAGVVVLTSGEHDGKVALFMAIDEVKFRRVVSPGDQLVMEIEIVRDRERTAQVKGVARVDGEVVVEAMMMFSYTDGAYLRS